MKPNKKKTIIELRKIFKSIRDKENRLIKKTNEYVCLATELEEKVEACLKKNKLWYYGGIDYFDKDDHGGDQLSYDYSMRMLTLENLLAEDEYTWYED